MGSSNRVCGISKAPIRCGEKVKLFYIVSNAPLYHTRYNTTDTYHHYKQPLGIGSEVCDSYRILGIPMDATYNDYGNYKVQEDSFEVKYNLHIIKKHFTSTPIPEDKDEWFDRDWINFDKNNINYENVEQLIRQGYCFLESSPDLNIRESVEYFAVLESVYNELIHNYKYGKWKDGSYTFSTSEEIINTEITKYLSSIDNYNKELQKNFEDLQGIVGAVQSDGSMITSEDVYEMAMNSAKFKTLDFANIHSAQWSYKRSNEVDVLEKYNPDYTDEELRKFISYSEQMKIMIRIMADANMDLMPSRNAGQSDNVLKQAEFLFRTGNAILEEREVNGVPFTLVPVCIEMKLSDIKKWAEEHWCTETKFNALKLVEVLKTKEDDCIIKPVGEYEAIYHIVNTTEIDIKVKVKE